MRTLTLNALFPFVLVMTVAAAGCDSKSDEAAATAGTLIYTSTDYVAAALAMEYTDALMNTDQDEAAMAESWQWVDELSSALGVASPPRDCTEGFLACFAYQRERVGAALGTQYGARAQVLYEIMIDTALVTLSLAFEDEDSARGLCNHIQARSATALVPDSIWRPLCALPAGGIEQAEQILAQHEQTREALLTWVEDRVDDNGLDDPNPQPFALAGSGPEASAQ